MSGLSKERRAQEEAEAQRYASLLRSGPPWAMTWRMVNEDIIARFSWTALLRIKERAWRIVGDEASQ